MRALGDGPAAREDRPATALLHHEANLRVVAFHLAPGQTVPPHTNPSTVLLQVLEGTGTFRGSGTEARLGPGATAVYAPGEPHAIEAGEMPLRFLAVLAPGPS